MTLAAFETATDDDVGDDLLRLVFTACHPVLSPRRPRRPDAAPPRRPHDRRDRPRVPRPRDDHRPADRPGQADAVRGARAVRGPGRGRARGPARRPCSRSSTSSSTRATRRRRATTGCDRDCATRPCDSAGCWPSWRPAEPEVHGLVALMEIQASRSGARIDPAGEPILLLEQDRASLGSAPHPARSGRARAGRAARWRARPVRAPGGHRRLPRACADPGRHRLGPHRRAVRRARAARPVADRRAQSRRRRRDGVRAGGRPRVVDRLLAEPSRSRATTCCPAVRGDLLVQARARDDEAAAEFRRAAELTRNERERRLLLERAGDAALG